MSDLNREALTVAAKEIPVQRVIESPEAVAEDVVTAYLSAAGIGQEIDGHRRLFDLRWATDMRAVKLWQADAPGRDLKWPDHTDLLTWLLEQLETKGKIRT